jgi:hypothetical protein
MLYYAYQLQADLMSPVRALAQVALSAVTLRRAAGGHDIAGNLAAAYEIVSRAHLTHHRPPPSPREIAELETGRARAS